MTQKLLHQSQIDMVHEVVAITIGILLVMSLSPFSITSGQSEIGAEVRLSKFE